MASDGAGVEFVRGDLLASDMQTHVNCVNCVGVMGAGIALAFKRRHPGMFADYAARCARGEVQRGVPYLYRAGTGPQIVNFPTKGHWRGASRLEDVDAGLAHVAARAGEWGVTSLAVPLLGCGCGGLDEAKVRALIVRHLAPLGIPVRVYLSQ